MTAAAWIQLAVLVVTVVSSMGVMLWKIGRFQGTMEQLVKDLSRNYEDHLKRCDDRFRQIECKVRKLEAAE